MSGKNMMWIILVVIAVAVGSSAVYSVDEREKERLIDNNYLIT